MNIKMLILLGLLISGFVFFSGCLQEKALKVPTESPTAQPTTTTDTVPTLTATVQPTTDTEIYCISNETGTKMSLSEARKLATNSEFGNQGTIKGTYSCNEGTSTWWIDMKPIIEKQGCSPAFFVNLNTKLVEINWRCSGAIPQNR